MNSVSWFLYLADILSGVQFFSGSVGVIIFLISLAGFMSTFAWTKVEEYIQVTGDGKNGWETKVVYPLKHIRGYTISFIIFSTLLMILAILVPSKETRFAIAASQVGEQIIQLEEVQEVGGEVGGLAKDAINLLRQNIQEQLTEKPVETSK